MKKVLLALALVSLLLCGCGRTEAPEKIEAPAETNAVETVPEATVPPDGNPNDVTCKGSYSGEVTASTVVAAAGDAKLTAGELQVWYWARVGQYRQAGMEIAPDFDRPLDTQVCEIDDSVASWQQYFLREALDSWHTAQALLTHSQTVPLPTEEAYQPVPQNYEEYMTGMPATKFLYGYNEFYSPNSMHQEFLDTLPDTLTELSGDKGYSSVADMARKAFGAGEAELNAMARLFNQGYMYFTQLTYGVTGSGEAELSGDSCVDVRHILLETETQAEELLKTWKKNLSTESAFADLAYKQSGDTGSACNGGLYRGIREEQLMEALVPWCFDPARQAGDTTVISAEDGVHVLYFCGSTPIAQAEAEAGLLRQQQAELIGQAKAAYPMEVTYSAILLGSGEGTVSASDLLYPDIAHERYPEIPLYLQQDYGNTMYGGWLLRTNGCGITSMAMVASYFADADLTPPEMCARFGRYSFRNGTDGQIFQKEGPALGFFVREKTYDPKVAKAALEEGQIVISIQHNGYWTRGGHYIVLEDIDEEGMIQVRDSNLYNYRRISAHANDRHTWGSITSAGSGYWIFEDKTTYIPACQRCGTPEVAKGNPLIEAYLCERCRPAMLRRDVYLTHNT